MADGFSAPGILFQSPTFDVEASGGSTTGNRYDGHQQSTQKTSGFRQRKPEKVAISKTSTQPASVGQDVYLGSYIQTTPRGSFETRNLHTRPAPSPRSSVGHLLLEQLLRSEDTGSNDYGVQELRDGFFDASFYRPFARDPVHDTRPASDTLPASFQIDHPLSASRFVPRQINGARNFIRRTLKSRAGLKLFKSFLGFFICYILCLIPTCRTWLGRYNYIIGISAIVNHSGRKIGSQIDGAVLTIVGTAAGLAWGSLALYVSTSNATARNGYGGVLAAFLVIFAFSIGWLRCVYIRFYQAVLCAGFAVSYICLANTGTIVSWSKAFDYGIPFVLGQGVCLIVSIIVFPDSGSRSLA